MRILAVIMFFGLLFLSKFSNTNTYFSQKVILSEPTELEKYLLHMATRESNNTPNIVNKYGMMGKYQFAPSTIKVLGYNISNKKFLSDSKLQDSVMVSYLKSNYTDLFPIIKKYNGKIVKGVKVTTAGVLSAAHLGGSRNVRLWFASNDKHGRTDANGTSLRDYMLEFSKYNLKFNPEI